MSDDLVKRLQAACHDPGGEPLEQDGFSNATVADVEEAIIEIARLRAALAIAKNDALAEAAKVAEKIAHEYRSELPEKWKHRPNGIPHDWAEAWEMCAEIADAIAASIEAMKDREVKR